MKPVQNFIKLHESEIVTEYGNKLFIEVGNEDTNSIWIFDNERGRGIQEQYCTLMTIDWQINQFDLRKCLLGQGFAGQNIHEGIALPIRRCKTKLEFLNFVSELIENEVMKGTYKN